jgi:outer membrane lipoprotein carrier protein
MFRRLGVLWLCAGLGVWADSTTDALISKVQSRYNGAKTLSVTFSERYGVLGHDRAPERGTLTLEKQGKMRWDYTQPAGKVFVSDGKSVFLYTAGDNRVEKVPIKDTEDMRAPLAFLLGRLDMKKEFGSFAVREDQTGEWLTATAKNDRVPYRNVEMLIGPDGSIRELEVAGRDESRLSFSFSNEKINPPVDEQLFHFTIPPGAQVVDSMEYRSEGK